MIHRFYRKLVQSLLIRLPELDGHDSHEALAAPIYLQGSENGHVTFRNIVITPAVPIA